MVLNMHNAKSLINVVYIGHYKHCLLNTHSFNAQPFLKYEMWQVGAESDIYKSEHYGLKKEWLESHDPLLNLGPLSVSATDKARHLKFTM